MELRDTFANRLKKLMELRSLSKTDVARICDINKSNVTRYCNGSYKAKQDVIYKIASKMHVNPAWLMGYDVAMDENDSEDLLDRVNGVDPFVLSLAGDLSEAEFIQKLIDDKGPDKAVAYYLSLTDNFGLQPMPSTCKVPRLGRIACGDPILAEENIEDYDDVPDYIKCDFTLVCRGDSMINARIFDGDIVCIKANTEIKSGEIAAVLVDGDDATLKRVRLFEDHIILEPENPNYRPLAFWEDDMNRIRLIGKATHFISTVR